MAGLSLRAGLGAGTIGDAGLTPVPAQGPTGPRASTAPAFGYQPSSGPRTAFWGCSAVSAGAMLLLAFLWWSLPR